MSSRRFLFAATLAVFGSLALGPRADAGYTYTATFANILLNGVTPEGNTFTTPGGTTVNLGNIAAGPFTVGSPLSANVGNIGVTTTSTAGDSFTVNYTINGTLTNNGQTITASVTGTLTFTSIITASGAYGGIITNSYNPPFSVGPSPPTGGAIFNITVQSAGSNFSAPGVASTDAFTGSFSAIITSSVVPEPTSVVMMGLGVVGVVGLARRHRRQRS